MEEKLKVIGVCWANREQQILKQEKQFLEHQKLVTSLNENISQTFQDLNIDTNLVSLIHCICDYG